jgi:hypothetical protein
MTGEIMGDKKIENVLQKLDHLIDSTKGLHARSLAANPDRFWIGNVHYELQIAAWVWAREIIEDEFNLASAAESSEHEL